MRTGCQLFLVACVAAFSAVADDTLLDESSECVFSADTTGSPYIVKSANEVEVLTYRAGESVTAIAPDGSSLGIVAAGASGGWSTPSRAKSAFAFAIRRSALKVKERRQVRGRSSMPRSCQSWWRMKPHRLGSCFFCAEMSPLHTI